MTADNKRKMQHTFDTVAAHLLTQNAVSMAYNPALAHCEQKMGCAYRGANGLRCAVGFCIPNHSYMPEMENIGLSTYPWSQDEETIAEILAAIDPQYCNDRTFMAELQTIHDMRAVRDWPITLQAFATDYKLDDSIVNTMRTASISQPQVLQGVAVC